MSDRALIAAILLLAVALALFRATDARLDRLEHACVAWEQPMEISSYD